MKKTLAVLATVATVGATMVTAPAQARGIGPGLAFGLAAGALAAGAAGAYYGPRGLVSPASATPPLAPLTGTAPSAKLVTAGEPGAPSRRDRGRTIVSSRWSARHQALLR